MPNAPALTRHLRFQSPEATSSGRGAQPEALVAAARRYVAALVIAAMLVSVWLLLCAA